MSTTATIIGSTGLIGSNLLELIAKDEYFNNIKVIVRRPLPVTNAKVQVHIIDFQNREEFKQAITGSDAVFCAVGTTQKKVKGDKDAYRKVDYDIPVTAAELCAETGVKQFLLVSSIGANSKSNNFYLKLKGEVENAVRKMDILSVSVFRPSVLLGTHPEKRPGEKITQVFMKTFSFLTPSKYKPISANNVAKAMLAASKHKRPRFSIYHYKEMIEMIHP